MPRTSINAILANVSWPKVTHTAKKMVLKIKLDVRTGLLDDLEDLQERQILFSKCAKLVQMANAAA